MPEVWEGKKYENDSSENFGEYMEELGVGFWLRQIGKNTTPTVELIKNANGTYTLRTTSTFKDTEITFELGKPFQEETLDGRIVTTTVTLEGNVLTQRQGGEKPSTIIRTFTANDMVAKMTVGDVVCTRHYKSV